MTSFTESDHIFNSALETGIRSICILTADDSMKFDLQQLLAFDHLVVHTGDIQDAPPSLHPNVLQRNGELLVRRPLVERGLLLMESKRLVEKVVCSDGFYYSATELAFSFIENLTNTYIAELHERSKWAVNKYKSYKGNFFIEIFDTAFDRWANEFQIAELSMRNNRGKP